MLPVHIGPWALAGQAWAKAEGFGQAAKLNRKAEQVKTITHWLEATVVDGASVNVV